MLGLDEAVVAALVATHWQSFAEHGILELGPVLDAAGVAALAAHRSVDDLSGRVADHQPVHDLLHHPLLHEVASHVFGERSAVGLFRCTVGPQEPGADRWSQAAGALRGLDRDDLALVVVALADGPALEARLGTHRLGLVAPDGSVPEGDRGIGRAPLVRLDLRAGHAVLVHRWVVHRVLPGASAAAFWLVDGRARDVETGYPHLPLQRGVRTSDPYPCVRLLVREIEALRAALEARP